MSYARVLVEIDLREELQHSVAVSLSSGPFLQQKAVYESLPKFCNFCNVIGHTRSLCSKAATASATEVLVENTLPIQIGKGSVFDRLGPQIEQQLLEILALSVESTDPVQLHEFPL
ncbi:hypothetical protein NC653_002197 [Populus alba x Populus x berolinensis]|uniref:Uncharacterized protein n=2 Tax=Populus TaxID=3689 RepID=A0A4U5MZW0_POPAL|nr:hypothetical protein NC653_002197 [Populus alba x Populus x berolinensis]TKR75508.1 hypothetical protein D5086_0000284420 [Populus alba]